MTAPAFLVGFAAEARIALRHGWPVGIGGGTTEGAIKAAWRLVESGATALISFGLAGGLDPALPAGALVVAEAVVADGQTRRTNSALNARLGGTTGHLCLGLDRIVVTAAEKRHLRRQTGAALVDMESGAVAAVAHEAGLPFAVLRANCNSAHRDLPPAAMFSLDETGRIAPRRLVKSILANPGQLSSLIGLARDAVIARQALRVRLTALGRGVAIPYGPVDADRGEPDDLEIVVA